MRKSKEAPFVFGVRVEGDSFTDRREETERLKANFTYGVNTILISPRRMGKTSLVDKVCSLVESEDIRIARIDAFGCRSENDFINAFATAVVRATSSKWEEWMENAKVFLSRFVPKISIGQDPLTDFSLALEYNAGNNTTEEVLRLPEMIARSKGCHIVVCIDEIDVFGGYETDSLVFPYLIFRLRIDVGIAVEYGGAYAVLQHALDDGRGARCAARMQQHLAVTVGCLDFQHYTFSLILPFTSRPVSPTMTSEKTRDLSSPGTPLPNASG